MEKRCVYVGNVLIGLPGHVVIQSMTNTKTKDIDATIKQINSLQDEGCEIVRVAILDLEDAKAIKEIKKKIKIPVIADIHFDYKLALASIDAGADKIRINPGNIGGRDKIKQIVEKCQEKKVPIRIGINSGSIQDEVLKKTKNHLEAFIYTIDEMIKIFEDLNFHDLVLSIKSTDINETLEINEYLDKNYDYPLHIGLTEAGTFLSGTIRSSFALATLLMKKIGNTIRVSLHGDPLQEIKVAKEILAMCGLYNKPTLIVCPTCGRTMYNMTEVVENVEKYLNTLNKKIKVAIMGCVVNGPGEAKNADIGIAGGVGCAVLFKKGQIVKKIEDKDLTKVLIEEIQKL